MKFKNTGQYQDQSLKEYTKNTNTQPARVTPDLGRTHAAPQQRSPQILVFSAVTTTHTPHSTAWIRRPGSRRSQVSRETRPASCQSHRLRLGPDCWDADNRKAVWLIRAGTAGADLLVTHNLRPALAQVVAHKWDVRASNTCNPPRGCEGHGCVLYGCVTLSIGWANTPSVQTWQCTHLNMYYPWVINTLLGVRLDSWYLWI